MLVVSAILALFLGPQDEGPARIRALISQLRSEDIESRTRAATDLKKLGKLAIPELRKATLGKDAEVASRARDILTVLSIRARLAPRLLKAVPSVAEMLAEGPPHVWSEMLIKLSYKRRYPTLTSDDLESLLPEALRNVKESSKKKAVCTVIWTRGMDAKEVLLETIEDENVSVVDTYMNTLQYNGEKETLLGLLNHKHDVVRGVAADYAGRFADKVALPRLYELLKDKSGFVRQNAAAAVMYTGDVTDIPKLGPLLKDPNTLARSHAASAIGFIRGNADQRAKLAAPFVPQLISLLSDDHFLVRMDAARALSKIGVKEAIPEIKKLLSDPNREVSRIAGVALKALGVEIPPQKE